jgi:hypothetical protein
MEHCGSEVRECANVRIGREFALLAGLPQAHGESFMKTVQGFGQLGAHLFISTSFGYCSTD